MNERQPRSREVNSVECSGGEIIVLRRSIDIASLVLCVSRSFQRGTQRSPAAHFFLSYTRTDFSCTCDVNAVFEHRPCPHNTTLIYVLIRRHHLAVVTISARQHIHSTRLSTQQQQHRQPALGSGVQNTVFRIGSCWVEHAIAKQTCLLVSAVMSQ